MTPAAILAQAGHRPWPLPRRPWIARQTWHHLLFAHWAMPYGAVRAIVPEVLPVDRFDGLAWVGIVPFGMRSVRPRFAPPLPLLSGFPELNVRTYVTLEGRPGVYFFSLDAARVLAVLAARVFFRLPYFTASMTMEVEASADSSLCVRYRSRRTGGGRRAVFEASYRPTREPFNAVPGTLEYFLTERYCLYTVSGRGVYRGDIHHPPWALRPAEAEIRINTMAEAAGLTLPAGSPLLHYADEQQMLAWAIQRVHSRRVSGP